MDKVRAGVIGIGGMGSSHAGRLNKGEAPDAVLTAVCDVDPARLEWAEKELGDSVKRFDKAEDLVNSGECDAVIIATPHYDHPPLAILAMEAGLHALVEKPAGVYTRQVKEMNDCAERTGKVLGIMFNQRTDGKYQKVRDMVQSGELGELLRINWLITNWFRTEAYYRSGGWRATWSGEGGGVLMNQCPHNIDLWQWMFGMPSRVRASCYFGKYHDIEVEDDVTAYMEYPNGATGAFITTTGETPGTNRLEVSGTRGKLVVEHGKLTFHRTREDVTEFRQTNPGRFANPECWTCDVPARGGDQHIGILKDFFNGILTGSDLLADGREGINCVEIINAMLLSGWNDGQWVDLPVDPDAYYDALQEKIANSTFVKKVDEDANADLGGSFNT